MAAYSITTVHMDGEQDHTVCIIGAGVSGLVTAKGLQRDGFDVTIFEKEPTIGGVWARRAPMPDSASRIRKSTTPSPTSPIPRPPTNFPRQSKSSSI